MGASPSSEEPPQQALMKQRPTLGGPMPDKALHDKSKTLVNTEEIRKFSEELLNTHNEYRAIHNVPPLKINHKLSTLAQEWVERLTQIGIAEGRPNNQFGENIYFSRWASDARSVCASWYKEGKHFKYGKEPEAVPVSSSNFTQMIWKSTTFIGIGKATSWANVTYVVCNYKTKGNVKGEFLKNILSPEKQGLKSIQDMKTPSMAAGKSSTEIAGPVPEFPKAMTDPVFLKMMTRMTNEFRFVHVAKTLKLNSSLSDAAQKEAEKMAAQKKLEPTRQTRYGASYYASKWSYEPKDVMQFWYKESKRFKFGTEPDVVPLSALDFTQMVWANTSEVGYGRAQASNGFVYIVAFYRPSGNIRGEYAKNVKPFSFDMGPPKGGDKSESFDRKRSVSRAVAVPQFA
ncbi:hypothetical protein GE061_005685 [Apolygus lucorum]|uniref:SCP domain-containing protein n=1 Tax=Apolygus lucorum TaxID=248454 RepID=A0A6A4IXE2_APOLU|nr:hypothetical protein GE061_005685 [Apolygus lucorum]